MSEKTEHIGFWNRLLTYYFEAKEAAIDRFKMPMIPYYLALIVLSYWEPLYILIFSSKPVEERTAYVRCMFQNYTLTDHLKCLGIALGFAFISSIVFPYLTILINWINGTSKKLDKREHKLKSQEIKLIEKENIIHQLEIEDIKSGKKEKEEYNNAIESLKDQYETTFRQIESRHTREKNSLTSALEKAGKATEEGILQMEKRFSDERKVNQQTINNLTKSFEERIEQLKQSYNKQLDNLEKSLSEQKKINNSLLKDLNISYENNYTIKKADKNKEARLEEIINIAATDIINSNSDRVIKEFLVNISQNIYDLPQKSNYEDFSLLMNIVNYFTDNKFAYFNTEKSISFTELGMDIVKKLKMIF